MCLSAQLKSVEDTKEVMLQLTWKPISQMPTWGLQHTCNHNLDPEVNWDYSELLNDREAVYNQAGLYFTGS